MISGIIYMIGVIVMDFFYPALYGICGIIIGSFLNVCILRIPEGQSFVTGRSHCPACKRQLYPFDMVPVLSFLFLGGKCRFCGKPISIQYPLVEAGTALLFFLCCLAKGPGAAAVIMCLFGSLLTVGAWIDARHMYIPDGISLSILILAAASLMILPLPDILSRMAGAAMCGDGPRVPGAPHPFHDKCSIRVPPTAPRLPFPDLLSAVCIKRFCPVADSTLCQK